MVFEHAAPNAAKSALSIEGAMMAGGDMVTARVRLRQSTSKEGLQGRDWYVVTLFL